MWNVLILMWNIVILSLAFFGNLCECSQLSSIRGCLDTGHGPCECLCSSTPGTTCPIQSLNQKTRSWYIQGSDCTKAYIGGIHGRYLYRPDFRSMKWNQAKAVCHAEGAHLVSFETTEEYYAVKAYIGTVWHFSGNMIIIGGKKASNGGPVYWETGEKMVIDIWGDGEPNKSFHYYTFLYKKTKPSAYLMDDANENMYGKFICEKNG